MCLFIKLTDILESQKKKQIIILKNKNLSLTS